jgi:hypothetical protein
VTPAGIVVGRGTVGVVGVVVVGGGGGGGGGGAVVVVPVVAVVPSCAVAVGLAASRTAESSPAAAHATNKTNVMPRRLTAAV